MKKVLGVLDKVITTYGILGFWGTILMGCVLLGEKSIEGVKAVLMDEFK